jgi:hypothetical protein
MTHSSALLRELDEAYLALHVAYETAFWREYMGTPHDGLPFVESLAALDAFRGDPEHARRISEALDAPDLADADRSALEAWEKYFALYSYSAESLAIKERIAEIESRVNVEQSHYRGGYADPDTGEWISMPVNSVNMLIRTSPDERIRQAAHESMEIYAVAWIGELAELVALRNELARTMGYGNYYDMQARRYEGVPAETIFGIFDRVRERLSPTYDEIRTIALREPSVLKPWNFVARFSGEAERAIDPYFPMEASIDRWLRSMRGLGVDFSGGNVTMDLVDRPGKHRGGFCHWPVPVHYAEGQRRPATAEFSCNALPNALGSGSDTVMTLFHEGGHAAHMLACEHPIAPLNTEYPPTSVAWAETQSMWFDGLIDSLAWRARYARDRDDAAYPEELHREILRAGSPLRGHDLLRIAGIVELERRLYTSESVDEASIERIAREVWQQVTPCDESSNRLLSIPHIYALESSCYYHGYGLALMGVAMLDRTFLERYGYRTDCPRIAADLREGWQHGGALDFFGGIELVAGRPFSPDDYIDGILADADTRFAREKAELDALADVPMPELPDDLSAVMRVENGTEIVAESSRGLRAMEANFRAWTREWERCSA